MCRIAIISCEVFKLELELLIEELQLKFPVHYLPQGLHDTPDELKSKLQRQINSLEDGENPPEKIFLFYGFCGRGLAGIFAKNATLVLPNVHDCIPVLLGISQEEKDSLKDSEKSYWLTAGWLKYSQLPFVENRKKRFEDYKSKFGEDSAQYLMELEGSWLSEYDYAALIKWDNWEKISENLFDDAKIIADDASLECKEVRGSNKYMKELLTGGEDRNLFVHIKAGETIALDVSGKLRSEPRLKAV